MKLIEDLGVLQLGNTKHRKRYGIYECPICENHFKAITGNVLRGKTTKCRKCANAITNASSNERARESISALVKAASKGTITVSSTDYVDSMTKVKALCICGYTWYALPNDLKDGHGCIECTTFGFDKTKPGILYYLKLLDNTYKIGITNSNAITRFPKRDHTNFIVLREFYYSSGLECYRVEQLYHKAFKEYRVDSKLLSSGHTEVYSIDVLCLDVKVP